MIGTAIMGALAVIKSMSSDGPVRTAVDTVVDFLGKNERITIEVNKQIDSARKHDAAITVTAGILVKNLHASVRPIVTYVALGCFAHSVINGITLSDYEYIIIGGIFTFWFGIRPFEKKWRSNS